MTTLYHSADASHDWPCVVKIDDKKILVEYQYEGEALVQYTGTNQGHGHFKRKRPIRTVLTARREIS